MKQWQEDRGVRRDRACHLRHRRGRVCRLHRQGEIIGFRIRYKPCCLMRCIAGAADTGMEGAEGGEYPDKGVVFSGKG